MVESNGSERMDAPVGETAAAATPNDPESEPTPAKEPIRPSISDSMKVAKVIVAESNHLSVEQISKDELIVKREDPPAKNEATNEETSSNKKEESTANTNASSKKEDPPITPKKDPQKDEPTSLPAEKEKEKKKKKKGHKQTQSTVIPYIPAASERDGESEDAADDRIRLGICAMDKKARSKPMAEILSRLDEEAFRVIFFGDDVILNKPIEEWPVCHVLIAFYSKGYPLEKAMQYVELRKPFTLNDLPMQKLLMDRRKVYDLLEGSGIDVPRHVYMSRDTYVSTGTGDGDGRRDQEVIEHDDHIEINGVSIHKPFVEKPVDADDHNIAIYYPTSAGGGCKKLFRKIGNRSSEFYPDINEVRRDGSYIYEEFVETQGTDVKMYTVGPEYGHAEARKSPTVDGKVERNSEGKEVRFPVILTLREKEIARRIVLVFKQFVCGFDLLRVQVGPQVVSYVCDVNGFSFVKNSRKYYDDCAQILSEHILATVKPHSSIVFSTLDPLITNVGSKPTDQASKDSFFSRATRMLSGEPADDHADSDENTDMEHSGRQKNTSVNSPARSDASAEILASAAATLVEGAIPVREIPNHLLSEPASMCPSEVSSQAGDPEPTLKHHQHHHHKIDRHVNLVESHEEELRCVIAVIRHGDRTPKQKLKVNMKEPSILKYFHDHAKDVKQELKVKAKAPMTEFLDIIRKTLAELEAKKAEEKTEKDKRKAEKGDKGDGEKAEKPEKKEKSDKSEKSGKSEKSENGDKPKKGEKGEKDEKKKDKKDKTSIIQHLRHIRDILERWRIAGMNRKLQLKPKKWEESLDENGNRKLRCTQVQLVFKYGGNLTRLGENQALRLGRRLRRDAYPDVSGGGILRLHSTFRHDLKIKTSDEGRVMKTAAAFAKGLLELEGDLPPILVSLVHKEKGSMHMLDPSGNKEVKMELDECKERITANLQRDLGIDKATTEDKEQLVGPLELTSLHKALKAIKNPRKTLDKIHKTMGELIDQLEEMLGMMGSGDEKRIEGGEGLKGDDENDVALSGVKLYKGETLLELTERWRILYKNLYDSDTDKYDLSRIPDVHDNVRFDVLHNPHLGLSNTLEKLYNLAKNMADCVVPQEYGTTTAEKRSVGVKISKALLEKIMYDLTVARADNEVDMRYMINMAYSTDLPINTMGRRVRTRLYFTSESHLHTMLNVLRFAKDRTTVLSEQGVNILNGTSELCYLTQIVMRLFEDSRWELDDPRRFRVEILFSPGATATPLHMHEQDRDSDPSRFDTAPLEMIGREGLTCQELEDFFQSAVLEGASEEDELEKHEILTTTDGSLAFKSGVSLTATSHAGASVGADSKKGAGDIPFEIPIPPADAANEIPPLAPPESQSDLLNDAAKALEADEYSPLERRNTDKASNKEKARSKPKVLSKEVSPPSPVAEDKNEKADQDGESEEKDEEDDSRNIRSLERKYFWGGVALGSFMLATSLIVLAFSVGNDRRARRYNTKR